MKELEWIPVKSSNLLAYAYDPDEKVAFVRFVNGGEGRYTQFPSSKWSAWQRAASKGGYLNAHVKTQHPWLAGVGQPVNSPVKGQEQPVVASSTPAKPLTTPGPVQTALMVAKRQMGGQTHRVLYFIWAASGKPEVGVASTARNVQHQCLNLLGEIGNHMIDGKNIDQAIKLAAERGL